MTSVPQTFSGAHDFDINNPIFNAYSSFHSTVTANGSHTEPVYLDEIDTYVRLLHGRNGYPLWEPKQRSGEGVLQLPDEYRKEGVRIGDIGILSKTGDFDYFFNACLPADHPVNQGRVPQDFIQLDIDIRNAYSKEIKAGFIANNTSHFNHRILEGISDLQSPEVKRVELFTSKSTNGALLVLPEGAKRIDQPQDTKFRRYAAQCARSWRDHIADINGNFGREVEGLYIITGCDKTRAWGLASFFDTPDGSVFLEFTQKQLEQGQPQEYDFTRCTSATAFAGTDHEFNNQSGCVFLRGYKIAVRGPSFTPTPIGIHMTNITDLTDDDLYPKTTETSLLSSLGQWILHSTASNGRVAQGSSGNQSSPSKYQLYHCSDVVNKWILDNYSEVDVAITHDNDWASIIENDEEEIPEVEEIINHISRHLKIVHSENLTYAYFELPTAPVNVPLFTLQEAAFQGNEAAVNLWLANGADVNAHGGEYGNALMAAAFQGHEAIVRVLLENGADINAKGGKYGHTLLRCRLQHLKGMQLM